MKKYLVIYNTPAEAMAQMGEMTEEQRAEGMKVWMDWKEKHGGAIVDLGAPLGEAKQLKDGSGPAPLQNQVSGYSIVQAGSKEELMDVFSGHPHLGWHPQATIDVHECAEM